MPAISEQCRHRPALGPLPVGLSVELSALMPVRAARARRLSDSVVVVVVAGAAVVVVVARGRGAEGGRRLGRRGASYVDWFRAKRGRPAQNPLVVSREVALVVAAVVGPLQRALELVHEPVVELVEGARAAGFGGRGAGAFAGGLEGALGGTGGGAREVPAADGHGTVGGRREKIRARRGRQ